METYNARLIAHAPELLDMLEKWVQWYEVQNGPLGLSPGRLHWERTRNLIEKVTGEPKKPLPDPRTQVQKDIEKLCSMPST